MRSDYEKNKRGLKEANTNYSVPSYLLQSLRCRWESCCSQDTRLQVWQEHLLQFLL